MATQVPVQKLSFRGIYTIEGGIFTPCPLDWSFHLPHLEEEFYFENTPNKTLLFARNRSLTATFRLTQYPVGLPVQEYPDYLDKATFGWIDLLPGEITITGPFSTNFNIENNHVYYLAQGYQLDVNDVDLAVVQFPE